MSNVIVAVSFFLTAFSLMAVGVIFSNRRIKGSCGGIGAVLGDEAKMCDCGQKMGGCSE
ncbi:(Na+)-NQR maturation NqrM [Candidatus Uabimicrobium amorphum]|uniref:(Na+)-NQR maturation NqrM n=1 Tax=Uabimicrobium amorphum TaxID=2596890 RepID=A0A5S9IM02_UABAM|nr:(Na+)-NQR maturation NqrM [Candidatus Uabimicrobium amorphum]BBM83991.1 hypothetical protein UABAM_02346 [Candidatus Uabimicrobium amorphum]